MTAENSLPETVTDSTELRMTGRQGKTVFIKGATVVLHKKASLVAAERVKTLPIRNISSVEVKKPGALAAGFIQFSIAGGAVLDSSCKVFGGAYDAAQDENSVVFINDDAYRRALKIKEFVENYGDDVSRQPSSQRSVADELLKFKQLLDRGVIRSEEFLAIKQRLLVI